LGWLWLQFGLLLSPEKVQDVGAASLDADTELALDGDSGQHLNCYYEVKGLFS
jgi:hypothetical protein